MSLIRVATFLVIIMSWETQLGCLLSGKKFGGRKYF